GRRFATALNALPTWSEPVRLGAKRTLTVTWPSVRFRPRWSPGAPLFFAKTASPPLPTQASREAAGRDAFRPDTTEVYVAMPMPHRTFQQVIKRRLVGKEGSERVRELRAILGELPGYKNGPYADLRKWVQAQIEESRARSRIVHRDSIAVRREGAAQIALVGAPNAGKSSLLHALSDVQIKIGNYAFTTLRPVPALTRIGGVLVQLVEIPGLIAGAAEDRGGGRALLSV